MDINAEVGEYSTPAVPGTMKPPVEILFIL